MAENPECLPVGHADDPFALARALDNCAKWWWGTSLIFKLLGFGAGVFVVLPIFSEPVPFIVAMLVFVAELSWYRSEAIKSRAQGLRRNLDLQDSLGWEMSSAEFSDLLMRCPRSVMGRSRADTSREPYFASTEPIGPRRALQNVSESAWWTKHLSENMGQICLAVLLLGILAAVVVLVIALQTIGQPDIRASVARIVTAWLMLLVSLGFIRMSFGYYGLSRNAGRSEQAATGLLESGHSEVVNALKIMNEYHVARALGPIIPTWIWKFRRNELSTTWRRYRSKP